ICSTSADCPAATRPPSVCREGICTRQVSGFCSGDSDCDSSERCDAIGHCVAKISNDGLASPLCSELRPCEPSSVCSSAGTCSACSSTNLCAGGLTCANGVCVERAPCTAAADCYAGRSCTNGACGAVCSGHVQGNTFANPIQVQATYFRDSLCENETNWY